MLTEGPIARTVGDLRLALSAMSGFHPRDLLSVPMPYGSYKSEHPIRVGIVRDVGVAAPSQAVTSSLNHAARYLSEAGYIVEEIELPLLEEAYRLWYLLAMEEFRDVLPMVQQSRDQGILQASTNYYEVIAAWWGNTPGLSEYMRGYARRGTLVAQLQSVLEEVPIVLLPVSTEQAFPQDQDIKSLDGARRAMEANWSMMAIACLGFPGVSVPVGVNAGLPCGVQLLGRRFREEELLDAAEVIEARAGQLTPIDPR